jgi:hypothetical protein
VESNISLARDGGQPLSNCTSNYFGPRFGYDFSAVRVHTDPNAERMSGAINARAFTIGRDIFFGRGQYAPETDSGKRLLAHELTHVLQQGKISRSPAGEDISIKTRTPFTFIQRTISCPEFRIDDLARYWSLNVCTRIPAASRAVWQYHLYDNALRLVNDALRGIMIAMACSNLPVPIASRMSGIDDILGRVSISINAMRGSGADDAAAREDREARITQLLLIAQGDSDSVLGMLDPGIGRQMEAIEEQQMRESERTEEEGSR